MILPNEPAKEPSEHVCIGCGTCCRGFSYVQLTRDDVKTLEDFTGLSCDAFSDKNDAAGEDRFLLFQENGDCIFLRTLEGRHTCSVYEARSVKCRTYPTTKIQNSTCSLNSGRQLLPHA